MNEFWRFAGMMLHYRRLLGVALVGVLIDAVCVMGGFGSLTWIITMFFEEGVTIRELVTEKFSDTRIEQWTGLDLAPLATWVPAGELTGLAWILGLIFVLAMIGSAGRFTHEYFTMTVVMRTVMRIRKLVFTQLVHLPVAVAGQDSTAERITKIVRDCQQLTHGFTALVSRAVRGVVLGMALLLLAFYLDWMLAATFLFIVPPVMVLIRKFGKKVRKASRRALRHYGVMLAAITEALQGLRVVKVHHAEGYERRRFNRINREALRQEMRARTAKAMSAPTVELFALVGVIIVMMIAGWSVYGGGRQSSEVVSVLMMLAASAGMFRTVAGLNNNLQEAAAAAQSIDEVLKLPVERSARQEQGKDLEYLPRHHTSVVFEDVWYTYPGSVEPAVRGVTLKVEANAVCAIVGANGSGKTTLLGLLPRLYEPTAGRVRVDGRDIANCTLRSLRRQIAIVTQETVLFEGTIADNIRYGSRHVTHEQVEAAAKQAHAHGFIQTLPDGYQTELGERGMRLSGGQRQRLALARAILRDPAILILDEATSQIDADSEARITEALSDFMRTRTTFVIAHRLSTVVNADTIVVMDEGTIASIGTHQQLLQSSDVYRVLCRTQLQGLPQ